MIDVYQYINNLHERRGRASSGIVYCRTRATCDELADFLGRKGLQAKPYHRGLTYVLISMFAHRVIVMLMSYKFSCAGQDAEGMGRRRVWYTRRGRCCESRYKYSIHSTLSSYHPIQVCATIAFGMGIDKPDVR